MGDNVALFDRNGVRTPMQWNTETHGGFSVAKTTFLPVIADPEYNPRQVNVENQINDKASLWNTIQKLIAIRKENEVLAAHAFQWIDCDVLPIAAFMRQSQKECILAVHNLSDTVQSVEIPLPDGVSINFQELFTGKHYQVDRRNLTLKLAPYQYLWLKATD